MFFFSFQSLANMDLNDVYIRVSFIISCVKVFTTRLRRIS